MNKSKASDTTDTDFDLERKRFFIVAPLSYQPPDGLPEG